MSGNINVLIVDDEPSYHELLRLRLVEHDDINVVGTVFNGVEALQFLDEIMVDVVLCDVRMPLMDGVGFTEEVAHHGLPCKVLALTTFNDEISMLKMMNAGAAGFVLKSDHRDEIAALIRATAQGSVIVSANAAGNLRKHLPRMPAMGEGLSNKDRDVFERLHLGRGNRDIAADLGRSEISVKRSVSRLMRHFGARSRGELVALTRSMDS